MGPAAQTRTILAKIDALLAEVGSSKSKLLQVQIWLADIRYYDEMNAVWDAWVDPANTPGRATCEARMATPRALVEDHRDRWTLNRATPADQADARRPRSLSVLSRSIAPSGVTSTQ